MSETSCPRCGNPATEMHAIDGRVLAKLKEGGVEEQLPSQVCGNCFQQLVGSGARGGVLMARERAKEQKKLMLWQSRVALIKKARQYMIEKMFSDAAVAYEKYIRVVEVVFECKPGELSPEKFKDSARTQELTIVASAYWDLLRIYDTSEKYGERQAVAAKKLAQFLRFTPIMPDVIRKAEVFQRTAKNPAVIKSFLKAVNEESGRCFIATSAFQYHSPEVEILSEFRDQVLCRHALGRMFINSYYRVSPPIASFLDKFPALKLPVRLGLRKIVSLLKRNRLSATRHRA